MTRLSVRLEQNVIAAGERHNVFTERLWKADPTVTPVMYCHHSTGGAWTPYHGWADAHPPTDQSIAIMVERLAGAGHPVISADLISPLKWPDASVMTRIDQVLAQVALDTGCRSDRVLILADSLGTANSLNWARRNVSKVAAMAIPLPVPNITYYHDNLDAAGVEASYGGHAAYLAAMPAFDPNLATATAWAGIPIQMWTCSDDPAGVPAVAQAFCTRIGIPPPIDMGAHGHTIDLSFDSSAVTDFLLEHA